MVQNFEQHSTILLRPVQISPRSFKTQIETVLGALVQLRIRARIFAKLPRGHSWLADLVHYSQVTQPTPSIYLLSRDLTTVLPNGIVPLAIPSQQPMQGDYFLLIVAETVGVLLTGQRRNISLDTLPTESEASTMTAPLNRTTEEPESLTKVDYRCTVQPSLIHQQFSQLHQLFELSLAEFAEQPELVTLLTSWDTVSSVPKFCHPAFVDTVLLQQGSYQEQLQQKARTYRRQATTASNLSTQNEALLDSLRLKDSFLSKVGQELRTPLSSIKTALPLLASPNLKPPQRQRYLEMISRECDRQVNLINGVLELLQIERGLISANPEPIKLFDILPGIVSTYQPLAQEKGIRLAYTVPNTLPAICCPENWIRQIVIQLLHNSIRYTDAGGEVWVTAQDDQDDMLTINIQDTGTGIAGNELPYVFDHFYRGRQLPSDDEGAGLGLSIVQQLLIYAGGHISVESEPDIGSHFTVKLPVYQES
jgi:signal transduction histidine kinase